MNTIIYRNYRVLGMNHISYATTKDAISDEIIVEIPDELNPRVNKYEEICIEPDNAYAYRLCELLGNGYGKDELPCITWIDKSGKTVRRILSVISEKSI